MKFTRRHVLQAGGMAAAALALPRRASAVPALQFGSPQAGALWTNRFTHGNLELIPPVLTPVAAGNNPLYPGHQYYKVAARQFQQTLPGFPAPTTFWGYNIEAPSTDVLGRTLPGYLGGLLIGESGTPVALEVENRLTVDGDPASAPLPVHCVKLLGDATKDVIDNTIAGSPVTYPTAVGGGGLPNRITTHLHGGDAHWDSDGHPLTWYSNNPLSSGNHGQYWNTGVTHTATGTVYQYPNNLSARLLWYHDHAESITRLNAYAGLATGYILRDDNERQLVANGTLPPFIESSVTGSYDIQEWPLVIQEKAFQSLGGNDELYYHANYDPLVWTLDPAFLASNLPYPSCIPEFYGDISMVNGVAWPKLDLKAGMIYRFRVLNAAQARFYNLAIYEAKTSSVDGGAIPDFTKKGPQFYQIGTEGGFLPAPVKVTKLMLGPAERVDFLLDLRTVTTNKQYILYGAAPAPLPGGDPTNDYPVEPGLSGPGTIMMFNVVAGQTLPTPRATTVPTNLWPIPTNKPVALGTPNAIMPVTLNEGIDNYGRLTQYIGNFTPHGGADVGVFGREFLNVPGVNNGLPIVWETHTHGNIEEWSILNMTADVHPMHFHIVNVQILSRQPVDTAAFLATQTVKAIGPAIGPDPNERGWKETVRCYPGQITRVRMIFPPGYTGHYVWHCHILEHEEHDMMHEFELV